MKTMLKVLAGLVLAMVCTGFALGHKVRDLLGYAKASAEVTAESVADGLPREVRDKKLENDLAQVRAELVERRVKLSQSARQIETLRAELKSQTDRAERDKRVLIEACPVLESAVKGNKKTVKFASVEMPLGDFQHEVDDLLARRDRDGKELAIKREALARLESRQRQAEEGLADSARALEAAEREVALLKSRRDHAEVESRTIALVNAISDSLKAPRQSVGESLGRLRDEVSQLEARNEAERSLSPATARVGSQTITREFDRLEALKAIQAEAKAEAQKKPVDAASKKARLSFSATVDEND
jgi:chromosome segregation ATPase